MEKTAAFGKISVPVDYRSRLKEWLPTVGSLLVVLLVSVIVILQMNPPAVVPATAPAGVFSAERAFVPLQVIASTPHPTGSLENAAVRLYLFNELAALGLSPDIQTSTGVYHDTGKWGLAGARGMETTPDTWSIAGATVHNIMARIPGTDSTGAILLMAHYDSVPYGPGASDDGVGVAAIIETARAILSGTPLRNDVILLLTDGEEIGLMGAKAFTTTHPWMKDISLVFNLEARGSSGPVLMYETSVNNAWLMKEYARAAYGPLTSSLATGVYRLMPNSSDLTLFLDDGKQGMNFAFTENWTDYHTTHDSLEDLDERSLQHHGANVLSLARHFGSIDLTERSEGDAIFFSILRLGFVQYPERWAGVLMAAAIIAFLMVFSSGYRRKRLSVSGLGKGMLAFFVSASLIALIAYLAVLLLEIMEPGELRIGMGGTYNIHLYELGLIAIYLPVAGLVYAFFQQRVSKSSLAAGGLFVWLLLTCTATLVLPGGSYLFFWPLAAGLLSLFVYIRASRPFSVLVRLVMLLPVITGLVLAGTAVYLVQLMFGVDMFPVGGVLIALLIALIFPYLDFLQLPLPRIWAAAPAAAGILLLLLVKLLTNYDVQNPRLNFMFYSLDADAGTAAWVAQTNLPDPTLAPWLGNSPGEGVMETYFPSAWQDPVWMNEAPVIQLPAPELRIMEDTTQAGIRTLRLRISSPRNAEAIMADIRAEKAIIEAGLYGEWYNREEPRDHVFFKVISVPAEGVDILLKLRAGVPVTVRLGDVSAALPEMEGTPSLAASRSRSGYGGGHGIDSMSLIHRKLMIGAGSE